VTFRSSASDREDVELAQDRRRVTPRSALLGLACAAFVAAFAPYNDFVLNNTYFIGNHFPIGITLMMVLLILCVNPLLKRLMPGAALRSSELITVWAICLVGASIPTTGLLRQLIPWMAVPIYFSVEHPEWNEALNMIPDWLFPTKDPENDRVVARFFLGANVGEPVVVPWDAWRKPLAMWALYYVPLFAAVILISVLLSRQWIVHEKLQYPIATVMLEMVADAPPGRRLNALFGNRRMWMAAGLVMMIHLVNGLHSYYPKVPEITIGFNLQSVFTEGVWQHYWWFVQRGTVYFSMIGIAFLMAADVSLSLWFFLLLTCTIAAFMRYAGIPTHMTFSRVTQGANLAMGLLLLFLARRFLWSTFLAAFGGAGRSGDHAVYRWVVRLLVLCLAVCVAWLIVSGLPAPIAAIHLGTVLLSYIVFSRIVAETGMFFVGGSIGSLAWLTSSVKSHVLWINTLWLSRAQETLMPFAINAMRLGHEVAEGDRKPHSGPGNRPAPRGFVGVLFAAVVISMIVGTVVWLLIYYSQGAARTNQWIALGWTQNILTFRMMKFIKVGPPDVLETLGPMSIGVTLVFVFGFLRARFARWPFVPIALCLGMFNPLGLMWLSILIGWTCKTIVMRTGGVALYHRLRPVFLGMVIGEVFMAGLWMVVGIVVRMNGLELESYRILPTN